VKILPFRPFLAAVAEHIRHPSSKRIDAGENPAGSAIARWCQSSPDSYRD
jgi:hypothetical protein